MLKQETQPKSLVRRLLRGLKNEEGAVIFVDGNPDTYETRVAVTIENDVRLKIGGLLRIDESDLPMELHPDVIARAINTLPDDMDLRCLADTLVAGFLYAQEEAVTAKDSLNPEGRSLSEAERRRLAEALPHWEMSLRKLYYSVLARKVEFSSEDWRSRPRE